MSLLHLIAPVLPFIKCASYLMMKKLTLISLLLSLGNCAASFLLQSFANSMNALGGRGILCLGCSITDLVDKPSIFTGTEYTLFPVLPKNDDASSVTWDDDGRHTGVGFLLLNTVTSFGAPLEAVLILITVACCGISMN